MLPPEPIRQAIEARLCLDAAPKPAEWSPASGGLSDASVWRVTCGETDFAVRCWGAGIDPRLLGWAADALRAAGGAGCDFVAAPLGGFGHDAWPYRDASNAHWEAAAWKPGTPLTPASPQANLTAAIQGLARFHERLRAAPPCPTPTPAAYSERVSRLGRWLARPSMPLPPTAVERWPELAELAGRLPAAAARAARRLEGVTEDSLGTRQPIHSDPRPEHFLLSNGVLTGLIDFGAMRTDSILVDVARLAGELALGDADRFAEVVSLYERAAGVSIDLAAVLALDTSGAVLSAINWARWLSDPDGSQRDPRAVRERLRAIAARLAMASL